MFALYKKKLLRRMRLEFYRISTRLTLIYVLTVILTALTSILTIRTILPEHPRNQLSERLAIHTIKLLGETPDKRAYDEFTDRMDFSLMVVGPEGVEYRSGPNFPTTETIADYVAAKGDRPAVEISALGRDFFLITIGARAYVIADFVKDLSAYGRSVLIVAVLAIILILTVSLWAVREVIAPITPLHNAVKRIGRGKLETRVTPQRRDEIGTLATHINDMAAALAKSECDKRNMLIAIGHEFSSPIARVLFQAENVQDEELRDKIRNNLLRVSTLFRTLISVEMTKGGGAMTRSEEHEFPNCIVQIVAKLDDGSVVLDLPETRKIIFIDTMKLEILLSNFINNALRYAPTSQIEVLARHHADELVIRVQDCGPGIAPEVIEGIPAPFARADKARGFTTGGLGLGLYLCEQIVQNQQGKMVIKNRDSGGLSITVTLPCTAMTLC